MNCLVCKAEGQPICNACLSDISSACPLVWLRGKPGLPLIDILLMDTLAMDDGRFRSPPPFKSYINEAEKGFDDLKIEGVFAHLTPLPAVSDGDMELVEHVLQFAEKTKIPDAFSRRVLPLLRASMERAPSFLSSSEIENWVTAIQTPQESAPPVTPSATENLQKDAQKSRQPDMPEEEIQSMLAMAQMEVSSGNMETAIDLCDKVLALRPDSIDAMLIMSYAIAEVSPDEAVGFAEDAMAIEDSPRTRFAQAYTLYRKGAPWGKIVQVLVNSRVWDEQSQAWHVLLGEAYLKGGKKERAIEEFKKALQYGDERTSLTRLKTLGVLDAPAERVKRARDALRGVTWVKT